MTDTVKLIIEIPEELYENKKRYLTNMDAYMICKAVQNGTPLDSIKSKIETDLSWEMYDEYGNETALHKSLMDILDSVGKESEEEI